MWPCKLQIKKYLNEKMSIWQNQIFKHWSIKIGLEKQFHKRTKAAVLNKLFTTALVLLFFVKIFKYQNLALSFE